MQIGEIPRERRKFGNWLPRAPREDVPSKRKDAMGVTNCTDVGPTLSSHEAASGDACARLLQPWDAGLADATLSASVGLAESVASRPDVSAESAPHGSAAERRGESTLHRLSTGALDSRRR